MLPPLSRLPYREFRSRGYYAVTTQLFTLKIKKNPAGKNRLGIVIGVAAEKSAARRNFWKRHTKAAFQTLPNLQNDFLVIFSKNIKNTTLEIFKNDFLRAAKTKIIA